MITADPASALGYWCRRVARMRPGQFLEIDRRDLSEIPSYEHNGTIFTAADRILGNVVGSAYTHSHRAAPQGRSIIFACHEDTGKRHYEDPDRRLGDG